MHGTGQVTGGKLVGLTHIHQNIGLGNGFVGVCHADLMHVGFGCGNQIMGCFHKNPLKTKILN
jgi:hypothetical protein